MESFGQDSLPAWKKEMIDRSLKGCKLDTDARNVFASLDCILFNVRRSGKSIHLQPLPHYEVYLRTRAGSTEEEYQYVMNLSDVSAVTAFNQIVDAFNADLDHMNETQDLLALEQHMIKGFQVFEDHQR